MDFELEERAAIIAEACGVTQEEGLKRATEQKRRELGSDGYEQKEIEYGAGSRVR